MHRIIIKLILAYYEIKNINNKYHISDCDTMLFYIYF